MQKPYVPDELDRKILALLLTDGKLSYAELSKQVFASTGTVHGRMQKMIAAGIVTGQSLRIDHTKLGYDITAFIGVFLSSSGSYTEATAHLQEIPEIVSAHYLTGGYSIFLRIVCRDTDHLRATLGRIQAFEAIQRTETFISLEESINRPIQL